MTKPEPDFAFEKSLGVADSAYGNIGALMDAFGRLLVCMQECNKINNVSSEFFRVDFRTQSLDEQVMRIFPRGALVMDLKWGSKKELDEKKNDNA